MCAYSPWKFPLITEIGIAKKAIPVKNVTLATERPNHVTGYTSPYPTVVIVMIHHQNVAGILPK